MIRSFAWCLLAGLLASPVVLAADDDEDANETVAPYVGEDAPRPTPEGILPPDAVSSGEEQEEPESDLPDQKPTRVYRVVDAQGNVSFSDDPPANSGAEEITIGPTNRMPRVEPRESILEEEDPGAGDVDYEIVITSPAHEQTLRHPQAPTPVVYSITPPVGDDHEVAMLYDGNPRASMSLPADIPRGQHTVQIVVLRGDGTQVDASDEVVVYVHRPSRLIPAN